MPNSRLIDGQFAVGDPCWFDLATDDVQRATEFYSRVFGWSFEPAEGANGTSKSARSSSDTAGESADYRIAMIGERKVAGIGRVANGSARSTEWWVHFAAPDLNSMVRRVKELGGEAESAMRVPGEGEVAVARDPQGAAFGLWNPVTLRSSALTETPGTVHWVELHARDPQGVAGFYEQLFGVDAVPVEAKGGDEPGRTLNLQRTELGQPRMIAGILPLGGAAGGGAGGSSGIRAEPHWRLYFLVDDPEAVARAAEAAGGKVLVDQHDASRRRVLILDDPLGAEFAVVAKGTGSSEEVRRQTASSN